MVELLFYTEEDKVRFLVGVPGGTSGASQRLCRYRLVAKTSVSYAENGGSIPPIGTMGLWSNGYDTTLSR